MKRNRLPSSAISLWAQMNGIKLEGVAIEHREDGPSGKGYTVVAKRDITYTKTPLMIVPKDLVLSVEAVHDEAKYDKDLRELLEAAPELAMVRARRLEKPCSWLTG